MTEEEKHQERLRWMEAAMERLEEQADIPNPSDDDDDDDDDYDYEDNDLAND